MHLYGEAARGSLRDLFELVGKRGRRVDLNGGANNYVDVVGMGWVVRLQRGQTGAPIWWSCCYARRCNAVQWEVEEYCAGFGRCTYMVKPPDGFEKYRIQEWWEGSQAGAPNCWSCQWRVCGRRGLRGVCSQGKPVHLYGGAAAMSEGVMSLEWKEK